jgi:NCS1 family nucleobase:cation symporter-1
MSTQMLKAIWPSLAHMPNYLPAGANITTAGEQAISLPLILMLIF